MEQLKLIHDWVTPFERFWNEAELELCQRIPAANSVAPPAPKG